MVRLNLTDGRLIYLSAVSIRSIQLGTSDDTCEVWLDHSVHYVVRGSAASIAETVHEALRDIYKQN